MRAAIVQSGFSIAHHAIPASLRDGLIDALRYGKNAQAENWAHAIAVELEGRGVEVEAQVVMVEGLAAVETLRALERQKPRLAAVDGHAVTADDLDNIPWPHGFDLAEPPKGRAADRAVAPTGDPVKLHTYAELAAAARASSWLVRGMVAADALSMIFGAPKTFKSFVALDLALSVAHGLKWCGKKTRKGPIVYVAAEGGTGLARRIDAWHRERKLEPGEADFRVVTVPLSLLTRGLELRQAIEQAGIHPALIVVDTMAQTFSGDENASADVSLWLAQLRIDLQQPFGAAVVVVHHTGHSQTERPRGSSAIIGNTDALLAVWRDEKEMGCTLANLTQKDGEPAPDVSFSLTSVQLGEDEDGEAITSLSARALVTAEEAVNHVQAEARRGRNTSQSRFLACAKHGQLETLAREEFYRLMGDDSADTKRRAWNRALKWALDRRIVDVSESKFVAMAGNV